MDELSHLRIGIGHDTHRLKAGGPLRLGGIDIPYEFCLDGHSDADVLLHAITDAILGAAAMGDIGELFPDTDPENHGRDSADMLLKAMQNPVFKSSTSTVLCSQKNPSFRHSSKPLPIVLLRF